MGPHEIANLTGSCAGVLTGLILLAVGFVVARPANQTAGYVVAAAGGLQLLSACCDGTLSSRFVLDRFGYELSRGGSCLSSFGETLSWVLVTYGAVLLAQAASAARPAGAS